MKLQTNIGNALGVAALLVVVPLDYARGDDIVAKDESVFLGSLASLEYTREGAGTTQDLPVFVYSCGSLILNFFELRVLAGRALPEAVRTVNPLGESCSSALEPSPLLFNFRVLASVLRREEDLTVSWLTFTSSNDDGIEVIAWTAALEDRYGPRLDKQFWCDELAPEDQPEPPSRDDPSCYQVQLDDFIQMFAE